MDSRQSVALESRPVAVWPPDDTEESVLGTNLHQTTITNLRWGLNEAALATITPEQAPRWQALGQTMITGFRHPDGSSYTVLPDIFVYRQPIDEERQSLSRALDGPPLLIIEVASESTYQSNLDLVRGKGFSYADGGVQEYLVLDPMGKYVPEGVRAWRLQEGSYTTWPPEPSGAWKSREIPVLIALEGARAAVYTADGRRQLREGEVNRQLERTRQEYADELERAHREHAAELAELRRQIDELRRGR